MKYDDLKRAATKQRLTMTDVSKCVGMTHEGLKRAIDRESLTMRYVPELCNVLGISPNMLFDFKSKSAPEIAIENTGLSNTQNINTNVKDTIQTLQDQLAEKDRQIAKLLDIVAKAS